MSKSLLPPLPAVRTAAALTPLSVCWNITARCNLHCVFCFRDRLAKRMPTSRSISVVDILARSAVRRILFSGGEPLLVPHLGDLVRLAKSQGLITSLGTNGLLLTDYWIDAISPALDSITLSIDGEDARTHAAIRGTRPEVFEQLVAHLRHLATTRSVTQVNSVVLPGNINSLEGLGEILESTGVRIWRLLQFYPLHHASRSQNEFAVPDSQFNRFVRRIRLTYAGCRLTIAAGSNRNMSGSYFCISPDGTVYTSRPGQKFILGHIFHDPLEVMAARPAFQWKDHARQYQYLHLLDQHIAGSCT